MIDDAGEQTLVDVLKFDWRKLEGIFAQKFGDSGGNDICFGGVIFKILALVCGLVIRDDPALGFFDVDLAFDVIFCGREQIIRGFKPVDLLETDRDLPGFTFFCLRWLSLADIFAKIKLPFFFRLPSSTPP